MIPKLTEDEVLELWMHWLFKEPSKSSIKNLIRSVESAVHKKVGAA